MVSRATAVADIFSEFYDLIDGNVPTQHGGSKWIYSSFPDEQLTQKSDYPILVVGSPDITEEKLTLKRGAYNFTIDIELYHNSAQTADTLGDTIREAVMLGKMSLSDTGIQRVKLDKKDKDMFLRGAIKVHVTTMTFSGFFYFDKVTGY